MSAQVTVEKTAGVTVQDVKVVDARFQVVGAATLSDSRPALELFLDPGRYMAIGTSPNAAPAERVFAVESDTAMRITVGASRGSPHEWMVDVAARGLIPGAQAESSVHHPSTDVHDFRRSGNRFVLPTGKRLQRLVGVADRGSPARSSGSFDVRSFYWSAERGRLLRSPLLEHVNGEHAEDFTRLFLPQWNELPSQEQEALHFLRIRHDGLRLLTLAVPLFASGSSLVIARPGAETQEHSVQWRLTLEDPTVDALLQMLTARPLAEDESMMETSDQVGVRSADPVLRGKLADPYGAIVAALVMLRYRRLERRSSWVENLANWFPWLPDAQVLSAWANLMYADGDAAVAVQRLAGVYAAGPPLLNDARKLARDMVALLLDDESRSRSERAQLRRLGARFTNETPQEIAGSPVYAFEPRLSRR